MPYSIVLADREAQVRETIRQYLAAGFEASEIHLITDDSERTEHLLAPHFSSRIGFSIEQMFYSIIHLYRGRGKMLQDKLVSLGLSGEAADYYESEINNGRMAVIAYPDQEVVKAAPFPITGTVSYAESTVE